MPYTYVGTEGDDILVGAAAEQPGNDYWTLIGLGGDDQIYGGYGFTTADGGSGDDYIQGFSSSYNNL